MKKIILLSLMMLSMGAQANVVDSAPENVFIYVPSTNKLKKQDGTVISWTTEHSMATSPLQFNPGPEENYVTYFWGLGHILDKPITSVRMTKAGSDDSFVMKVKIYTVSNRISLKKYFTSDSDSTFSDNLHYVPGHSINTGYCTNNGSYLSTVGKSNGEKTTYTNPGWDENAAPCTGQGPRRKYEGDLVSNTNITTNTIYNELYYYIKLETPNGTPEPGTYRGSNQLNWRTKFYKNNSGAPAIQSNTVNFNFTVVVEPEYHRVEAPSEVKFSKSADPNHRKTSFYADVHGIFSPQMMITATSSNGSGTEFKMNCYECPTSYPTITDIQDIVYDVDATIEGVNQKFSLQSGVTSTIDLTRDSNGYFGGNGVAKVRFDLEYDRSDSTTTVATDLNYEDTLTLVFEPVI